MSSGAAFLNQGPAMFGAGHPQVPDLALVQLAAQLQLLSSLHAAPAPIHVQQLSSPFLAAPQPLLRIESPVQQQETAGTGVFIPQYTGDDARPRRQKRQRSPRRRSARAQSMSPPLPGTSRVASLGPPGSPTSTLEEQLAYTAGSGAAGKPACEPALPCDSSFAAALCGQRFY